MGLKEVKVPIGMRTSYFAKITSEPVNAHPVYDDKVDMGAAVKGYVSITTSSGEIPGDDQILFKSDRFLSAQVDVETTKSDLEINSLIFGHTYTENGGELSSGDDEPPCGAYAFIEPVLKKDKSTVYRATFFYKVQAIMSSEKTEADTKKNDFNPKMNAVSFFVMTDNTGAWRERKEFTTEASAEAYLAEVFAFEAT